MEERASNASTDASTAAVGAFLCGMAAAALSLLWGLVGVFFNATNEASQNVTAAVLGLVLHVIFGGIIGLGMGFLYGIPVYLLLRRIGFLRIEAFILLGALGGAFVGSAVTGFTSDWPYALGFAFCGAVCAAVFWHQIRPETLLAETK